MAFFRPTPIRQNLPVKTTITIPLFFSKTMRLPNKLLLWNGKKKKNNFKRAARKLFLITAPPLSTALVNGQ